MVGQQAINGFVLAGGKSSRMGRDKALMQFGGKHLVLRAADVLAPFVKEVSLLGPVDRYENLPLPVIADKWPDQGPLAAVCTGLLSSHAEWNVFLACDLPRLSRQFIQLLVQRVRTTHADAVVPRTVDGWQPLAAAYHSRCQTAFGRAIEEGERSIIRAIGTIQVEVISNADLAGAGVSEAELANVNTPEDWARLVDDVKGG
jgi:molybdopterin-guanine dinucleotide biosynthesis protein A